MAATMEPSLQSHQNIEVVVQKSLNVMKWNNALCNEYHKRFSPLWCRKMQPQTPYM